MRYKIKKLILNNSHILIAPIGQYRWDFLLSRHFTEQSDVKCRPKAVCEIIPSRQLLHATARDIVQEE